MIKSKFSFGEYYVTIFFITCITIIPALICLLNPFKPIHISSKGFDLPLGVFGIILLLTFLYWMYFMLKFPSWIIGADGLTIKNLLKSKLIAWADIDQIDMDCKEYYPSMFISNKWDAVTITLKDGEKIIFLDPNYSNSTDLKILLARVIVLKDQNANISLEINLVLPEKLSINEIAEGQLTKFSDNYLTSFSGIFFYLIMAIFTFMMLVGKFTMLALSPLLFMTFFYYNFGNQLYYFFMSDNYLVVINHVFPWYKKIYAIENIKEVFFESSRRRSTTLIIVTKEFQSGQFAAGSLRNKTWKVFKARFNELQIPIKDEAGIN
jgi:hypothetical protein